MRKTPNLLRFIYFGKDYTCAMISDMTIYGPNWATFIGYDVRLLMLLLAILLLLLVLDVLLIGCGAKDEPAVVDGIELANLCK